MRPVYDGLDRRGTEFAMIKIAPEKSPAEPTPAMARPTIRAVDVGAIPQMKEPSSKMNRAVMKTHFKLKNE
jgi:hypothetical protein